tara:strand:- start:140 stop:1195 length:1056 start_codon:yes stop_codon:yes gene_type:complete
MLFKSTKKFTKELNKYLDSEDVQIIIYPKKRGIIEKTCSQGTWSGIEYTVIADVVQKGAIMQYEEGLDEFLEMLEDYDITELNGGNFFNLTLLESSGGEIEIEKVEWEKPLTEEEEKELEEYGGEHQLFDDGDWDIDVDFDNGDILSIEVEINDDKYILSKEDIVEDNNIKLPTISSYVTDSDNNIQSFPENISSSFGSTGELCIFYGNGSIYFARQYQEKYGGIVNQKTTTYYENGKIKEEEFCKEVEESYGNGFHFQRYIKSYSENGSLVKEGTFEYFSMKRLGFHKHYHENGQLKYEGEFIENKQEGLWKLYHENGQLHRENTFKDDEIVSRKCWDESGNEIEFEQND